MKDLRIVRSKGFDFIIKLEDEVVFCKPIGQVDVFDVMTLLCEKCEILTGESTLSLYKLIEEIIVEIRAEQAEELMNRKFHSNVA